MENLNNMVLILGYFVIIAKLMLVRCKNELFLPEIDPLELFGVHLTLVMLVQLKIITVNPFG